MKAVKVGGGRLKRSAGDFRYGGRVVPSRSDGYTGRCKSRYKKGGVKTSVLTPPLTFQLFIYESLSIRFHNLIKRTRDVNSDFSALCFVIFTYTIKTTENPL